VLALRAFHAAHPAVALTLNVTRHPFSFLGQMPADVDNGASQQWGGWPRLRREGPWHERLMDYSGSAQGRDQFERQVTQLGRSAGIEFDFAAHLNRQPIESQRLLLWAARFGKGEKFIAALADRHFQRGSEGECASCRPTLLAAAAEAGLEAADAEAFLDTDELHDEVWAAYGEMPAKGINAIPLFAFSVPEAGLLSGPFRTAGNKDGVVVSGSGNLQQFTALFEQLYRHTEEFYRAAPGRSLLKPAPDPWVGRRVRLAGLVARPEINGAAGLCERFDAEKGRYVVRLASDPGGKPIAVKAENLALAEAGKAEL
jgi:predicted DsbA family dithiol-disulfide isomerase